MGNALPHPASLFGILAGFVILLSWMFSALKISVAHPATGEIVAPVNLVSQYGLHRILTEMITNFTGFAPLGTVLVALLGIGVAESSGLIGTALRLLVISAPRRSLTFVIVLAGVLSNTASEVGYVLLVPLSAVIFLAVGRHPIAGLAATFAGVSGGYSANLLLGTVDPLLAGLSEEAARIIDPSYQVNPACNYYFMAASTLLITVAGTWVTERVVVPRLGEYEGDARPEKLTTLTSKETRGLVYATVVVCVLLVLVLIGLVPDHGFLRDVETGSVLRSPFMRGIVAFIFILATLAGIAFGLGAGTIRTDSDIMNGMGKSMETLGLYMVLVFFAAQFVAYFKWTNLGLIFAIKGAALLKADWRQLEFPATTNGIPRFFRADPDHEGMVKDQQVRRLVKLKKNEKTLTMAAAKAGMSRKTARKYLKSGKLPSQCQPERYWRTRSDPFESVWPEVKEILKRSPTVEAKAVFDHLCRQQEGAFQQGQLRTLQRRIKQWKAEYGEAKEVMFPQKYQPGHQAQSDFTFMGRLGVTIQGQPFPHLLYHFVLAYSNWEATTLCFSESFESLSLGLQNALWELGALPEEHRTDRLSAAVKNLKREEFTERYQALLRHFGMRSSRTQAGKAHENGDVEQSHHRLKRAIEQELLLRCSRDFSSREEYEGFVAVIVSRRNAARQKRLGEELAVMRPLPARRLDDFTRQWVRVSPSSTIRVRHNTYSVDSRLIGERVQVRVWADQVEVYYGGRRQARMPRLRGEGKHRIDYRHVIHSLVRKPGAFTRYRWREDLFPGILFRVAYDELRRDCPATADRQYLKILEVAAQEGEQRVREALQVLIERGQRIRFEALRECLVDPVVEPWEVMVEKMDVGLYDTLLENREVRS